ncbi:MAG: photosynthetic complex assembly protein PuhC [Acetobacteraceae bacterium]|nr:photosynthetic complex assembly protein PuhC [Acetobacteraceae bacterium]
MARPPVFPRLPLYAVFAVLTITVVAAFVGRATHAGGGLPKAALVAERDLRFSDRADGAVVVQSARDGHEVAVYEGEQGFLRGTLRGFARTRHLSGLGPELPFQLSRWSDGRLTLDDKSTGQHVELMAFGPTNVAVFAPLLDR